MHHNFLGSEGLQTTHIDASSPFSSNDIDTERRFVNLFGEFSPSDFGRSIIILSQLVGTDYAHLISLSPSNVLIFQRPLSSKTTYLLTIAIIAVATPGAEASFEI